MIYKLGVLNQGLQATLRNMASNMTFADWRAATNESLMTTAENLLDNLEDIADLLTEINDKYIKHVGDVVDDERDQIIQKFHEGVDSARNIVGVLKREKWRLSKREMSVEMRMGELEDYKLHLKNDMSSLNETVDVLSMRIVQLENQLVEAQELTEALEWEKADFKRLYEETTNKLSDYMTKFPASSKIETNSPGYLASENKTLRQQLSDLTEENKHLKELVRMKDSYSSEPIHDDHVARLTRDFLRELSNLDDNVSPENGTEG
ncbi:kinetochore protein SLK19-like isoform X1 [Biomphalaria glabrata]|nr:putative leucine-rich repeat-containing protein DD [Biomphalaria glabrata]KAI8788446.1 leucine-rich repeat-containing protein [Biomphalaria glabrata]